MEEVEPLQMPPMVLYEDKVPAFLLRWRRADTAWAGWLAIPQSQVDVRGVTVHGVAYRWADSTSIAKLADVDYSVVPRPGPGESGEVEPLKMPPMVLYEGATPAFLLCWKRDGAEGSGGWAGRLASPRARSDGAGNPVHALAYGWVAATGIRRLPEVDYELVPRS